MKYLLLLPLFIISCQAGPGATAPASENDYSTLTKENAEERLKALRGSIRDSSFAIMMDAGLAIHMVTEK